MSTKEEHKSYIQTHLHDLLQQLVASVLNQKPSNLQKFVLEFLREKTGQSLSPAQKDQLKQLRLQKEQLQSGALSHSDQTQDSQQDYIDQLPMPSYTKMSTARVSVSAQAFGQWNQRSSYIPRVFQKSADQRQRILGRLSKAFMFQALQANQKEIVINAMQERKFDSGDMVINQNDDGNELFLVDTGKLECWKLFPNETEPKLVKHYAEGESFGQLALLYNCPRAASIKATTSCVCWVLDRECFNHIVKDAAMRKREKYEDFLASVSIFDEMQAYERSQIADALQSVSFASGEYVIREGDWGDFFYMIEEGSAVAMKTLTPGCPAQEVKSYTSGDYFGELSLLKGEPRAASILATSPLRCVTLSRKAFKRMIGPLEDILRRNAAKYEGYLYN